jgi:hypothetical protein
MSKRAKVTKVAAKTSKPVKGVEMEFPQHEYGQMIPPMSEEQYNALRDDIQEHGLKDRITLYEGAVLEGYHRYKAIVELGRPPVNGSGVEWFKGTKSQALHFVISKNLKRRHLEPAQIGMILAKFEKHPAHGIPAKDQSLPGGTASASELAEEHGIGRATLERTRTVEAKGTEELKQAVSDGEIGAKPAAEIAQLSPKEQKKALKEARADAEKPKAPPKPMNEKPATFGDLVYSAHTFGKEIRDADPPGKKDSVWMFRCGPDDIQRAVEIMTAGGYAIESFVTITLKNKHVDPFTEGNKDIVLIGTKGDPSPVSKGQKFPTVIEEQKFIEHFGNAYPKADKVRFHAPTMGPNWKDWKGGDK